MYICICNAVTDKQIKAYVKQGVRNLRDLNKSICIGNQCGKCTCEVKKVIKSELLDIAV